MCVLLTSELVTNAVLYGQSELGARIELRISFTPAMVRIGVHDQSPAPPVAQSVSPDATSGRGLDLVDAVSSAWGVDATDGGKEVWFALWL